MKVFVTGGTGFIGLHLCRALVAKGHDVFALVRNRDKGRALPAEVSVVEGDLSLFQDAELELPEVDVFIHLAGVVAADSEREYWDINYAAVKDIARCLQRQTRPVRRMLFASSLAAAGPSAGRPKREHDVDRPVEPYGQAKKKAELFLQDAPFPVTSFRPAIVLGPGDPAFLTLFKLARRGLGFRVAGHRQKLSFVCVADVIDAILLMANDTSGEHRTYFVSHPRTITVDELWEAVGHAVRKKVVVIPLPQTVLRLAMHANTWLSGVVGFKNQLDRKQYEQITAPAWICDSSALRTELAWSPQVDLQAGAHETADGYRAAGWL